MALEVSSFSASFQNDPPRFRLPRGQCESRGPAGTPCPLAGGGHGPRRLSGPAQARAPVPGPLSPRRAGVIPPPGSLRATVPPGEASRAGRRPAAWEKGTARSPGSTGLLARAGGLRSVSPAPLPRGLRVSQPSHGRRQGEEAKAQGVRQETRLSCHPLPRAAALTAGAASWIVQTWPVPESRAEVCVNTEALCEHRWTQTSAPAVFFHFPSCGVCSPLVPPTAASPAALRPHRCPAFHRGTWRSHRPLVSLCARVSVGSTAEWTFCTEGV